MRWSFVVPGQPVSLDKAYITGRMPVSRRGRPVTDPYGQQKYIHRPILTDTARRWKDDVQLLAQAAKPSHWKPDGQLRVLLDLYLTTDVDADNVLKLTLDALAAGIDYNDRYFLPCIRSKTSGLPLREARVEITIDDDTEHPY